ncbi:MAG: hypothetical protein OSA11_03755 [Candidatus Nanopelagicales bacterium]|nr:hypothetical protein [Candidatus Nanopelagicales bacterium]
MTNKPRPGLVAVFVGIFGAVISALRLWLGNSDSLTQLLWAEDGVFPLCIHKAEFISCVVDPFAGYLLVAPRMLAGIVSFFPLSDWAVVANVVAAAVAGVITGLAYLILRRGGMGQVVSVLGGLIPVMIPIVGYEAVQSLGNVYQWLLYVSVLAVVFSSALNRWVVFALLLLTTLTMPTTVLLLPLVVLWWLRKSISLSTLITWSGALLGGGLAQFLVASNATKPRAVELAPDGVSTWANSLLPAFMTNVPGFISDGSDPTREQWPWAWLILAALVGLGVFLVVRGWPAGNSATMGALVLTGVVLSAFPTIFDGPGNRYFVVPVMLLTLAVLVSLNELLFSSTWWVGGIVVLVVLGLWLPQLPAGAFRSTPAPAWSDEVARVSAACKADPKLSERIIFTPFWPPDWGDALSEPTHPNVDCFVVWKWLD